MGECVLVFGGTGQLGRALSEAAVPSDWRVVALNRAEADITDGGEYGMGAEVGNSTARLHVRGPIGLEDLTTTKYVVVGTGQTRS